MFSSCLLAVAFVLPTSADLLSQTDTFDAGILNWSSGANPMHVATGGSLGSGDGFLQVSRPDSSPFHIAAFNKTQWTGNYLAAGITAIEVDLNAITGSDALKVRLVLWGNGGVWASSSLSPVAAGWNHYSFGLTASELVFVDDDVNSPAGSGGGSGLLADTLQNVTIMQLRHDYPSPTAPGNHPEHISATLGIDNFQAVPEPSTLLYMVVAAGSLMLRRIRHRRINTYSEINISNHRNTAYAEHWL